MKYNKENEQSVSLMKSLWNQIIDLELLLRKILVYPFKVIFGFIWNLILAIYEFFEELFIYDLKCMFFRYIVDNIRYVFIKMEIKHDQRRDQYIEWLLQHSNCDNESELREGVFGLVSLFTSIPEKIGVLVIFCLFYQWVFRYLYLYSLYGRYYKLRLYKFLIIMAFIVTLQFHFLEYIECLFLVDIHVFRDTSDYDISNFNGARNPGYMIARPVMQSILWYDYTENIFIRGVVSLSVCQWVWIGEEFDRFMDHPFTFVGGKIKAVIVFIFRFLIGIVVKPIIFLPKFFGICIRSYFRLILYIYKTLRIIPKFIYFFFLIISKVLKVFFSFLFGCFYFIIDRIIYYILNLMNIITNYPSESFLKKFEELSMEYYAQISLKVFVYEKRLDLYNRLVNARSFFDHGYNLRMRNKTVTLNIAELFMRTNFFYRLKLYFISFLKRMRRWFVAQIFYIFREYCQLFVYMWEAYYEIKTLFYEKVYDTSVFVKKVWRIFKEWVYQDRPGGVPEDDEKKYDYSEEPIDEVDPETADKEMKEFMKKYEKKQKEEKEKEEKKIKEAIEAKRRMTKYLKLEDLDKLRVTDLKAYVQYVVLSRMGLLDHKIDLMKSDGKDEKERKLKNQKKVTIIADFLRASKNLKRRKKRAIIKEKKRKKMMKKRILNESLSSYLKRKYEKKKK